MFFTFDFTACLMLLLFLGLVMVMWRWAGSFQSPHFMFSNVQDLKMESRGWRERYCHLPKYCMLVAFALFALAVIDPHYYVEKEQEEEAPPPLKQASIPTEGVAIYLVLDQSGSMSQEVSAISPKGIRETMTKMNLMKLVTQEFVKGNPRLGFRGRPNDMIGLIAFARGVQVLSPLTLEHQTILEKLDQMDFVTERELDGTSIGYAIYKGASIISATRHYAEELVGEGKPAYEIKSAVMILVTDGFQSPSPLDKGKRLRNIDLNEAAEFAKQNDIRVYIINVEPRIASEEFAAHRKLMKNVADTTGGRFYLVDSSRRLEKIYSDIDRLEKSILPIETGYLLPPKSDLPHLYRRVSFFPYLIAIGMVCLMISVLFEGVVMRKVP